MPETSKLAGNWGLYFISSQSISFDNLYPDRQSGISFDIGNASVSGITRSQEKRLLICISVVFIPIRFINAR